MLSPLSTPAPGRVVGTGLSAVLHLAVVALVVFGLPDLERPAHSETVIPITIVPPPQPEPEPAKPEPETARKPPEPETKPEVAETPPPPKPAKPEPQAKPEIAEKPPEAPEPPAPAKPALEDIRPDATDEAPAPDAAPQEAKRTDGPADITKPSDKAAAVIGRWILQPLTVKHTGHPCGDASESGTIDLIGERGPGAYHGTLRTHVKWTRCPAQVASYYIELRIKGSDVLMVGSGFVDSGTVNGDVMSLKDAYGVSIWRRQKTPPAPARSGAGGRR